MKTLNEVIDNLEYTNFDDDGFAINLHCNEIVDVLNYLKEYRSIWESDRKHYEDWIEQYKDSRNKHQQAVKEMLKNPPLTWDELKEMEGKPVWMERPEWKEWLIVSEIDNDKCEIYLRDKWGNGVSVNVRNPGYWRAYRKERE